MPSGPVELVDLVASIADLVMSGVKGRGGSVLGRCLRWMRVLCRSEGRGFSLEMFA